MTEITTIIIKHNNHQNTISHTWRQIHPLLGKRAPPETRLIHNGTLIPQSQCQVITDGHNARVLPGPSARAMGSIFDLRNSSLDGNQDGESELK